MSYNKEREAIATMILSMTSFVPTQWPNNQVMDENFQAVTPNNEIWRRVSLLRNEPQADTLGRNGADRYTGVVHIDVFVPKNDSDVMATEYADEIAEMLKWRRVPVEGFCLHTKTTSVSPMPESDVWYGMKVKVFFEGRKSRGVRDTDQHIIFELGQISPNGEPGDGARMVDTVVNEIWI